MTETLPRMPDEGRPNQRRTTGRDPVDHETIVLRPGEVRIDVRLIDLSARGFHARCGLARFDRGESIRLQLPLVSTLPARVMWSVRGCFGGQFQLPIDARTYLDLLAQVRATSRQAPFGR